MVALLAHLLRHLIQSAVSIAAVVAPAALPAQGGPPAVVGTGPGFVVFRADKDVDGRVELYRAELDGSAVVKLNPPAPAGGGVSDAWLSPDGSHVALLATLTQTTTSELWIVRSDGTAPILVLGPVAVGGTFQSDPPSPWSPDSKWFAFAAKLAGGNPTNLYTVRSDGSQLANVSNVANPMGDVRPEWHWSPDSSRLAFTADADVEGLDELFTAPPGGPRTLVEGGFGGNPNFDVTHPRWSPDGSRLAYLCDWPSSGGIQIRVEDPTGGNTVALATFISPGWQSYTSWAPDGSRMGYLTATTGQRNLLTVKADGSDTVQVNGPLVAGRDVLAFKWSPDSQRLMYRADESTNNLFELYGGFADGSGSVKFNGPVSSTGVDSLEWYWSPDGSKVSYRANQNGMPELFVSNADGTGNLAVNGPLPANGQVMVFGSPWSPDGVRLAYVANQIALADFEVFTTFADGSGNVRVSPPPVPNGDAFLTPQWTSDSKRLVFRGDLASDTVNELFVAQADGSLAQSVQGPLVAGGDVNDGFQIE